MINKIIKKVGSFYNKKVIFNYLNPINEQTKTFKVEEKFVNNIKYITYIRLNEYDDFIEVIDLKIFDSEHDILFGNNSNSDNKKVVNDINKFNKFIAGIDLSGKKLSNGKIKAYISNEVIDIFPEEFEINSTTYTLENIIKGKDGYISAQYA